MWRYSPSGKTVCAFLALTQRTNTLVNWQSRHSYANRINIFISVHHTLAQTKTENLPLPCRFVLHKRMNGRLCMIWGFLSLCLLTVNYYQAMCVLGESQTVTHTRANIKRLALRPGGAPKTAAIVLRLHLPHLPTFISTLIYI